MTPLKVLKYMNETYFQSAQADAQGSVTGMTYAKWVCEAGINGDLPSAYCVGFVQRAVAGFGLFPPAEIKKLQDMISLLWK